MAPVSWSTRCRLTVPSSMASWRATSLRWTWVIGVHASAGRGHATPSAEPSRPTAMRTRPTPANHPRRDRRSRHASMLPPWCHCVGDAGSSPWSRKETSRDPRCAGTGSHAGPRASAVKGRRARSGTILRQGFGPPAQSADTGSSVVALTPCSMVSPVSAPLAMSRRCVRQPAGRLPHACGWPPMPGRTRTAHRMLAALRQSTSSWTTVPCDAAHLHRVPKEPS